MLQFYVLIRIQKQQQVASLIFKDKLVNSLPVKFGNQESLCNIQCLQNL